MTGNERIQKFLEMQNEKIGFADIAKKLNIAPSTLRSFLNKQGYKSVNGIYSFRNSENKNITPIGKKEKQIQFEEITKNKVSKKATSKKEVEKKEVEKKEVEKKEVEKKEVEKKEEKIKVKQKSKKTSEENVLNKKDNNKKEVNKTKNSKVKKDRRINITQDDLDKLCEVYDWYMQIKDNKSIKIKKTSSKKDVTIENEQFEDLKSTSIKVDKKTWEDFERLCSNSDFSKQQILTQALKDFMKEYKHML